MNRADKEPRRSWQSGLQEASPYLTLGIQLAGAMLVYVLVGYFLDRWLDTTPWLLVAGSVVGMVAFFVQLYRVVKRMNRETEDAREEREME